MLHKLVASSENWLHNSLQKIFAAVRLRPQESLFSNFKFLLETVMPLLSLSMVVKVRCEGAQKSRTGNVLQVPNSVRVRISPSIDVLLAKNVHA